jgi:hypothetical protein
VLIAPSSSSAAVTIGSNLGRAPDGPPGCAGGTCTFALGSLTNPSYAAPNGVTSPVNGTVTTWRIRAGATSTATSFRVIRPLGGGLYTGAGTSATVTPPINATTPFSTQLPIQIGDLIGIDCCATAGGIYFRDAGGDRLRWDSPSLADGGPGRAPATQDSETLINAEIEPTSAFTIGKVKKLDNGNLRVTAVLPNAGTLVAGDRRDPNTGASAAAKEPRYLKRKTTAVTGAGTVTFKVKATEAAREALEDRSRVKAKLRLKFTATDGSPAVATKKTTLKG